MSHKQHKRSGGVPHVLDPFRSCAKKCAFVLRKPSSECVLKNTTKTQKGSLK